MSRYFQDLERISSLGHNPERDMASRMMSIRFRLIASTTVIVLFLHIPASTLSSSNGWSSPCTQICNCTRYRLDLNDDVYRPLPQSSGSGGHCICHGNGLIPEEYLDVLGLEVEFVDHVVLDNGSFTNGSFSDLTYYLTLSGVQYIKPGGFRAVASIKQQLIFRGMFITVLEKNVFMYLDKLQEILAGDNNINALEDGCFEGLRDLRNLSLVNNSIVGVSKDNFLGLTTLQRLDLSKNSIVLLKPRTFELMPDLRDLKISTNAIVRIERGAFFNLTKIEMISLDGNQIQVLPEPHVKVGKNFHEVTVTLHNNPLHCDCRMNWISSWLDIEGVHCTGICQSPEKLKGHTLVTAYKEPLAQCRNNHSEIRIDKGNMAILTCPVVYASWIVPGDITLKEYGQSNDHYYLTNGDSLVVWNTQLQQQGTYACISEDKDQQMVYNLSVHMSKAHITMYTVFGILIVIIFVVLVVPRCVRYHSRRGYQRMETHQRARGVEPQQVVRCRRINVNAIGDRDEDNHSNDEVVLTINNLGFHRIKPDEQIHKNIENVGGNTANSVIAK